MLPLLYPLATNCPHKHLPKVSFGKPSQHQKRKCPDSTSTFHHRKPLFLLIAQRKADALDLVDKVHEGGDLGILSKSYGNSVTGMEKYLLYPKDYVP